MKIPIMYKSGTDIKHQTGSIPVLTAKNKIRHGKVGRCRQQNEGRYKYSLQNCSNRFNYYRGCKFIGSINEIKHSQVADKVNANDGIACVQRDHKQTTIIQAGSLPALAARGE